MVFFRVFFIFCIFRYGKVLFRLFESHFLGWFDFAAKVFDFDYLVFNFGTIGRPLRNLKVGLRNDLIFNRSISLFDSNLEIGRSLLRYFPGALGFFTLMQFQVFQRQRLLSYPENVGVIRDHFMRALSIIINIYLFFIPMICSYYFIRIILWHFIIDFMLFE